MDAGPKRGQCLVAQAGDGRHHFTRDAAEVFDHYAGQTLIDFGYECDRSWVQHARRRVNSRQVNSPAARGASRRLHRVRMCFALARRATVGFRRRLLRREQSA